MRDKAVLESTLSFLDVLQRMMLGKETSRLKGLYLFWNQVDKRETRRAVREVRAGSRRHEAADAANSHPRHETLPQGGGRHGTDGVPLHAAGSRQADGWPGSGIPELTREIATILKLEGYEETAE